MKYFFERLKARLVWSWRGVHRTYVREYSFRAWVWSNVASGGLALVLPLETGERALILVLGILVLAAELMNTAIEDTVDYISTDIHPLAESAKDAASAGVFLTAFATGVAWAVILWRFVV